MGSKKTAKPAKARKKSQRRNLASPTTLAATGRKRSAKGGIPTAIPTTLTPAEREVYRLRALRERARNAKSLREKARIMELVDLDRPAGGRPRLYSDLDLKDLAGLYINMVTLPNGGAPFTYQVIYRLDLLNSILAGSPTPSEFLYETDRGLPMSRLDAVRNVMQYRCLPSMDRALELIRQGMKLRAEEDLDTLDIPTRRELHAAR